MKRSNYTLLISFIWLLVLTGCKKEPDTQTPTISAISKVTLNGIIELPTGSPRNVNDLRMLSPVANGSVTNGRYQVATIKDEFTTQIAVDAAGKTVLMGYNYPGQTDFTINSQSTVLALLMNTGGVYSLTDAGKQQLIPKIKADPAFAVAVQEVERLLRGSTTTLLDTTNNTLGNRVVALFTNVARRPTASNSKAVTIYRIGRALTFVNAGVPFYNTVGIYNNGQQIKQLTVGGENFIATSLGEVIDVSAFKATPTPASETYSLPSGDGQFDVRVRTGKFGSSANGPEQGTALAYNIAKGILITVSGILPQLKGKKGCIQAVEQTIRDLVVNLLSTVTVTDATSATIAVNKLAYGILKDSKILISKCQDIDPTAALSFAEKYADTFDFLNKQTARIGSVMNLTVLTVSWGYYPAAQDTCYQFTNGIAVPCGSLPVLTTSQPTSITASSAFIGGNISSSGGVPVTDRGICWSTTPNPTITNSIRSAGSGIGNFITSLVNLTANTTYYVKAYATNSSGTAYGNQVFFTTATATPASTNLNGRYTLGGIYYGLGFAVNAQNGTGTISIPEGTYPATFTLTATTLTCNSTFSYTPLSPTGAPTETRIYIFNGQLNNIGYSGNCSLQVVRANPTTLQGTFAVQ